MITVWKQGERSKFESQKRSGMESVSPVLSPGIWCSFDQEYLRMCDSCSKLGIKDFFDLVFVICVNVF